MEGFPNYCFGFFPLCFSYLFVGEFGGENSVAFLFFNFSKHPYCSSDIAIGWMGFRTCSIRWGFEHKMCFQLLLWKALLNTLKTLGLNSCFDRFFFYFWGRFWHTPISFAWKILWSLHSFLTSVIVILILVTGNDIRGIISLQCEMFLLSSFPPDVHIGCDRVFYLACKNGMVQLHYKNEQIKCLFI